MQTRNDGTHVILPAAAPIDRRPDRARLPVTMLRQSDGKVRHDGSSAARAQSIEPVAERGRLHGASDLEVRERQRAAEKNVVYLRGRKEKRRWRKEPRKHDRLRRQDKGARGTLRSGDGISSTCRAFARCAPAAATSRKRQILNDAHILVRCAGAAITDEGSAIAWQKRITSEINGADCRILAAVTGIAAVLQSTPSETFLWLKTVPGSSPGLRHEWHA